MALVVFILLITITIIITIIPITGVVVQSMCRHQPMWSRQRLRRHPPWR